MRVKVLFVDIDGCLNSHAWYDGFLSDGRPIPRPPLDRAAVARLDRIVRATGAWIVLSTAWRFDERVSGWLVDHGCSGTVVGRTPDVWPRPRGVAIGSWLNRWARYGVPISKVCILDDDDDMGELTPWLVRTDPLVGLQDGDVERAIALLGGGS